LRTLISDQQEVQSTAAREAAALVPQLARNTVQVLQEATQNAYLSRQSWNAMALAALGVDASRTGLEAMIRDAPSDPIQQAALIGLSTDSTTLNVPSSLPTVQLWSRSNAATTLPRPMVDLLPVAPWAATLTREQWMRWRPLEEEERIAAQDPLKLAALAAKYEVFSKSKTSPTLRILAEFHALRLRPAAFDELEQFVVRHGGILTESGVPLSVTGAGALIKAWQAQQPPLPPRALLNALVPILVLHPTPMNSAIIRNAEAAMMARPGSSAPNLGPWIAIEEEMKHIRATFSKADVQWLNAQQQSRASWMVEGSKTIPILACTLELLRPGNGPTENPAFPELATVLFQLSEVERLILRAIGMTRLPEWAGVRIILGGAAMPNGAEGIELASTGLSNKHPPGGIADPPISLGALDVHAAITLARPEVLMASVTRRQRIYGLLVLAVAGTVAFGLFQARRSFQRQLQLAEMRSGFVSSVSHELRAPIASIRLLAEGLERGNATSEEQRRDYFRFIVQECRRLSGMIENVLDYSRIEQGREAYDPEALDLVRLVQDTVTLMEPCAASSNVSLSTVLPPGPGGMPEVVWDGGKIQQALVNLIDNAVKHSPEGATVIVSLRSLPASNAKSASWVELSVRDMGPGIPKAEHDRIFEQFYRRGSELRRETRGIGIGLSLVKRTVENHGGRISVQSEPGNGSTFTLAIPTTAVRA